MPAAESLQDLFVEELRDAYDAEKQLIKALKKMSKAATHPDLANAFSMHMEETNGQVAILEEVFEMLEMRPRGKHCPGIAGIIEEGNEAMEEDDQSPLLDAALLGGGRRAEHYEMAAYNGLIAMADVLGYEEASSRLQEILEQEIATDAKLEALGEMLLPLANEGEEEEEGDEGEEEEGEEEAAPSRSAGKKAAAKRATPAKKRGR